MRGVRRRKDGVPKGMMSIQSIGLKLYSQRRLLREKTVKGKYGCAKFVSTVQMLTLFNLIASCCLSIFQRVIKRLLRVPKPIILKFYL